MVKYWKNEYGYGRRDKWHINNGFNNLNIKEWWVMKKAGKHVRQMLQIRAKEKELGIKFTKGQIKGMLEMLPDDETYEAMEGIQKAIKEHGIDYVRGIMEEVKNKGKCMKCNGTGLMPVYVKRCSNRKVEFLHNVKCDCKDKLSNTRNDNYKVMSDGEWKGVQV